MEENELKSEIEYILTQWSRGEIEAEDLIDELYEVMKREKLNLLTELRDAITKIEYESN